MSGVSFPLRVGAVTIDLDGTLLDTIPDLAIAANLMLRELGAADLDIDLIRSFVGKGISHLVETTLAAGFDGPVDAALKARALEVFEHHYSAVNGKHTTIYPGVQEGLDELTQRGFALACVTNKLERYTLPLLQMTRLAPYFKHVVAGDTLARKKPDPAPLLHACDALGIPPPTMLMIGDSANDTVAARAAGCPVFCVTYGYSEGLDVRELDSDALVDSLVAAAGLIEKHD